MWGLSVNLCLPYATVFMLALELSDTQVGLVTSIYMFSQMIFAFLSGAIVDKLGRRKSTAIFDFISWSLPCLIWAFSQGFWFFVVAALLNGTDRKSTRLNSSHVRISYAVFCLKKKKKRISRLTC